MAKDKREEKQSILGELESIKDLLNEDEFADIPTLSNDLSVDDLNVDELSSDDLADIPVLTQSADDIPVLNAPALDTFKQEIPELESPEPEIPTLSASDLEQPEVDIPTLLAEPPVLDDSLDHPSTSEATLNTTQELNLELEEQPDSPSLQLTNSLFDQEIDSVDISMDVAEDLNLAAAIADYSVENHATTEADNDHIEDEGLIENSVLNENIDPDEGTEDVSTEDISADEVNIEHLHPLDGTTPLPELSQVPYALPGQQSLFESGAPDAKKDIEVDPEQAVNIKADVKPQKFSNKKSTAVKARGENPFLPQHIRDRLHTHKALVDIIKEHPPAPEQKAHPTNHIVESIIADYMPKIEAELRERLLKLADEGTLEEYTQKEDRPDKAGPE